MPAIQMVKCVISDTMSFFLNPGEDMGIPAYIIANHEKSCPCVIFCKNIEYFRCDLRNRTIIECKVQYFILTRNIT